MYLLSLCCITKYGYWYRHMAEPGIQQLKLDTNLAVDSSIHIYLDYSWLVPKLLAVDRPEPWTLGVVETPFPTWLDGFKAWPSYKLNLQGASRPPNINVRRPLTKIEKTPNPYPTLTQGRRNPYRNPCESGLGWTRTYFHVIWRVGKRGDFFKPKLEIRSHGSQTQDLRSANEPPNQSG